MSLLSLIYGNKKQLKIATIEVDVSVSETHETEVEVTENPIERGLSITDHVQLRPARLTIEGLVSDTPIRFLSGVRKLYEDNRSRKTYQELLAIQAEREPIDVVTGIKQYTSMLLKSLTVPRNADTGRALRFTAVFQEITILDSSVISVAAPKKYQAKVSGGKAPTSPASAKQNADSSSILSKITGLRG